MSKSSAAICLAWFGLAWSVAWQASFAGPIRNRIIERMQNEAAHETLLPGSALSGIRILRDIAYGSDGKQRFDAYLPAQAHDAPVIFMVHGGAWFLGDKSAKSVVDNKVAHWAAKGIIVVSTNYRLLPQANLLEQAGDVARALAKAQRLAAAWGGDRSKFILLGHSAGAHLVALLESKPSLASGIDLTPWLGAVSIDSAALDVASIMNQKHARFYDRAFGADSEYWKSVSPIAAVATEIPPILLVCSTQRIDSCPQADRFAAKARSYGTSATVLEQNFSHRELNLELGADPLYTEAVDSFLASLDASLKQALTDR